MVFEDSVLLSATASKIFDFLNNMEANYLLWHPDHTVYRWVKGNELAERNIFYIEEKIGRELLKKKVLLTSIIEDEYIEFAPANPFMRFFLPKMFFIIEEAKGQTRFYCSDLFKMVWSFGKEIEQKSV